MGYLSTSWHHIRRSPYQAFAAIFITMQTFFVASVFTFLILGSARIISYFESLPQVTAFFKNEVKDEDIRRLEQDIKQSGKVSKVTFVSKQEALKKYKEQNKDDPLLLELVTADILPASLEIATFQIEDLAGISETLKDSPLVSEVIFPKDIVANLADWTNALRQIGTALTIVLAIDAIFILIVIIGIKISQRKEEIEIMRLLGATSWYIRWPFVFEGIIYGVSGAIVGWALATASLWYATPFLSSFLKGIPLFPIPPVFLLELLGAEISLAIMLGAFASSLAVLRYLK